MTVQVPTSEATRGNQTAWLPQGKTISILSQVIHGDCVAAPGDETLAISALSKYLRNAQSNIVNILSRHFDDFHRDI
jgi:hypothetical protein